MRVIHEMIDTVQNEFLAHCKDWEFDGERVTNVYRKGKNKLVIEFGSETQITLQLKANGKKTVCPGCRKAQRGWPRWWHNIAAAPGTRYVCHDCTVDLLGGGDQSDGEATGHEDLGPGH